MSTEEPARLEAETKNATERRRIRSFIAISSGQIASMMGSVLTQFALGVWVYQQTNSVSLFAIIWLSASLPIVVLSPIAGTLVDRWELRKTLILSDSVAAATTLAMATLFVFDALELWHIYVSSIVSSISRALQSPAFLAASTQLLPERHYARGSGFTQFGDAAAQIIAPMVAAYLLFEIGLGGILLIDVGTFLLAMIPLAITRIPARAARPTGDDAKSFWQDMMEGFRYVLARRTLMTLLGIVAMLNLLMGFAEVLVTPLVLKMADPQALGVVIALAGAGMLVGSLIVIAWGGPRSRGSGVLGFSILLSVSFVVAGAQPELSLLAIGAFFIFFWLPFVTSCSQSIWQSVVPVELQGRVFSVRHMIAFSSLPLAHALAGPLADYVFEPAMIDGGSLADLMGGIIGIGPGRGIALLLMSLGIVCATLCAVVWWRGPLRELNRPIESQLGTVEVDEF